MIIGRSKDLIISDELNVYQKDIEEMSDAMRDVFESAVFGVPHPNFGEAIIVAVVRRQSPDGAAATETCMVNALKVALANFKVPKRIHYIDELPRNSMGKVQKEVLRDQYA